MTLTHTVTRAAALDGYEARNTIVVQFDWQLSPDPDAYVHITPLGQGPADMLTFEMREARLLLEALQQALWEFDRRTTALGLANG